MELGNNHINAARNIESGKKRLMLQILIVHVKRYCEKNPLTPSQVEVQTQIGLRSDPVERTPVCSQTEVTGSGRKFERTTVWSMIWRWSDQRSIWSEKSDHRRIRAHLGLIRADFERTWVCSEMFSNAVLSDQGPFRAHYFF